MRTESFVRYPATLDEAALTTLLRHRPDVRAEPVPHGFDQLAQRLCGPSSLGSALLAVDRDTLLVGQTFAVSATPTVPAVARMLGTGEQPVHDAVAELVGRGLAWLDGDTVHLPQRLAEHWSADLGGGKPFAKLANAAVVNDLGEMAQGLGIDVAGLRKPEMVNRLDSALADTRAVAAAIDELPQETLEALHLVAHNATFGYVLSGTGGKRGLPATGLAVRIQGRVEIPREVAVALWQLQAPPMTGRPALPPAGAGPGAVHDTATAAANEFVRAVATLLDAADRTPITALKKGGVGSRERSRLATRLSLSGEVLVLCIDLASACGLLAPGAKGYAPTEHYAVWRAADPGTQWAQLATAWFTLDHAPTDRQIDEDTYQPPPLPLASGAGMMRRAVLRAAAGRASAAAAGTHVDWFCPLHGYPEDQRAAKVAAAIREGEQLGVLAADTVTDLGEGLLAVLDDEPEDPAAELAARAAPLLPEVGCQVIVQSDLTAVVSGQPNARVTRLLNTAAENETRAAASVWRFTQARVRGALDAGWEPEQLLAELRELSDRELPQPLEYLVTDVARRHGTVRVRGMRSCVVADEATVREMLHTRTLAKLQLSEVAPTVLSSPYQLDDVLAKLRAAGLSPVAEDATGAVIIEESQEHRAPTAARAAAAPRAHRGAAELAAALRADPGGDRNGSDSATFEQLALLNPRLDQAELTLLSDALDRQRDVVIGYRDKNGTETTRAIQPQQIFDRWLDSWCHLRNGQRDFTVGNIQSVAPCQ